MPDQVTDDSPGSVLFPEYETLYDLVSREVEGLTDEQLDWTSDQWAWAEWSIRRQVSHMARVFYGWMLGRWGEIVFPDGDHGIEDLEAITESSMFNAMDPERYHDLPVILDMLRGGIDLTRRIMSDRSVGFLQSHTIPHQRSPQWVLMYKAHPRGVEPSEPVPEGTITLEATIRHMYFEQITHLYNIQRLKRAQSIPTVVDVPHVGYWVLDGWDVSEPE